MIGRMEKSCQSSFAGTACRAPNGTDFCKYACNHATLHRLVPSSSRSPAWMTARAPTTPRHKFFCAASTTRSRTRSSESTTSPRCRISSRRPARPNIDNAQKKENASAPAASPVNPATPTKKSRASATGKAIANPTVGAPAFACPGADSSARPWSPTLHRQAKRKCARAQRRKTKEKTRSATLEARSAAQKEDAFAAKSRRRHNIAGSVVDHRHATRNHLRPCSIGHRQRQDAEICTISASASA